ncbi:MAG: hypothetical protein P4L82_18365 [Ancalomicrobiaceae bacterium]|nr:hypothetical protein [Ancalomicrobiaceae bacterium]
MRRMAVGFAGVLALAAPAFGFDTTKLGQEGSLASEDVAALLAKSPGLKALFESEAGKLGKTVDDIPCTGQRFPGSWVELGGARVAPYECAFGSRRLIIKADVRIVDAKGRSIETIDRKAMKRASDFQESRLTWSWVGD